MRYSIPLLFVLCSPLSFAQDEQWKGPLQAVGSLNRTGGIIDYRIGPGDLMEISVFGVDSFDQEVRISSSGKISIPFLGKISVSGLTGEELEARLTQLISEKQLIRDPQVSVFIKEYRSQPVYVLGAVNQPGQYMITQQLNVIDAITMAGGPAANAEDYALLQRRGQEQAFGNVQVDGYSAASAASVPPQAAETQPGALRIDLEDLLENGNLALNIPVQGGDVIHVPEKKVEMFYVVGDVKGPGAFPLPDTEDERLFVSQAISWAGGPGKTARLGKGLLVRYDPTGARTEMAVNFKDIIKGRSPDLPVRPNDVIFIPGSNVKTVGYGFLNMIPGTVSGTIIWGGLRR